jgi:hypothetical protein
MIGVSERQERTMNVRDLLILVFCIFNLIAVPLVYTDQPFDGVDNVARVVFAVPEPESRQIVRWLYDLGE